ncbi:SAM-dependent methyltransferase [Saccharopolyspora taberi]|uniref:SAM-dependent methyltransferase n=1 Tax=Saccharopolyspora taberi TaxID=60895 RepID=A0ABN3V717_9PSEU
MPERAEWVPPNIDVEAPSAARIYDFLLGGGHNFAIDRSVGQRVLEVQPQGRQIATSNRAFLNRAVEYMMSQGIDQFLDLGSGIPTAGNVHEVAQRTNPDARVVYVDYDPVAVAHSRLLLRDNPNATVIDADLREPGNVLDSPVVREVLDFTRPIGLLTVAIFHFVADERNPAAILARYRDELPSGSLVALSHLTADQMPAEMAGVVEAMRNSRDPMYFRSFAEVSALFAGLDLVEPGIVSAPAWRNPDWDDLAVQEGVYVGVGRKP